MQQEDSPSDFARLVAALERIATALEQKRRPRLPMPDPEVSDLDIAAACAVARRAGLRVRGPR